MHHEETFMIFLPFCQHHCTQLLFYTWKLLLEIRYRALSLHSDSLSRDHSPLLTYAFILTGSLTQREPSHPNVITCIHHFTPPSIDCSNSQVILTIFVTCVSSQSQKYKGGYSNRPCTCTRDCGKKFGKATKVENLSSRRVKAAGQNWSKRSTSGGCGLISFEVVKANS